MAKIAIFNDRYELLTRINSGGMGDVWCADDTLLGRPVALKLVLARAIKENPGAEEILRDEARAAGSLIGHEEIVAVLDLFDVDQPFHKGPVMVMEYVEGCNLMEWITVHSRSIVDAQTRLFLGYFIALQICEAINIAHKRDILHRDVKPHNVLIAQDGAVKVADFGLARLTEALTRSHTVWNHKSPLYAAPEQWDDEKPVRKTDIYQLCATIYHLLAGEPACDATSLAGIMKWHSSKKAPAPLSKLAPNIDGTVAELVTNGLSSEKTNRPPLWELVNALSNALMRPLRLVVDATASTAVQRQRIADLTDFNRESLKAREVSVAFPHPLEALREAIGVVIQGGSVKVKVVPARAREPKTTDS